MFIFLGGQVPPTIQLVLINMFYREKQNRSVKVGVKCGIYTSVEAVYSLSSLFRNRRFRQPPDFKRSKVGSFSHSPEQVTP